MARHHPPHRPDGSVHMSAHDIDFPNGIAFSPDESVLYVSNTRQLGERPDQYWDGEVKPNQFVQAYDVAADGSLSNSRKFGDMASAEDGVPDGMKVDAEGRVYCTGSGGVWVFSPAGEHIGIIRVPEIPANCAFGGPDFRTMLFTARTSVYSLRMTTPGNPLPRA